MVVGSAQAPHLCLKSASNQSSTKHIDHQMGAAAISDAPLMNALGFTGGGLLAVCLIPQIIKLLVTRSARDISLSWTLLYLAGG